MKDVKNVVWTQLLLETTNRWQYWPRHCPCIHISYSFSLLSPCCPKRMMRLWKKLKAVNPEPWHVFLSICLNILPLGPCIRITESISWAELFLIVTEKKECVRQKGVCMWWWGECDTVPGASSKLSGCVESPRAAHLDDSIPWQPVTCPLVCLPFSGWGESDLCLLHLKS